MKRALLCLAILGCQSSDKKEPAPAPAPKSDIMQSDCSLFLVKARATIQQMGGAAGLQYTQSMEETAIKDCEADVAAGKPMVLARCVLDAKSEDAVHACFPTYEQVTAGKPK